jgi:phosphatidylglycerol:prolipoprotein diacylglycerol transferase
MRQLIVAWLREYGHDWLAYFVPNYQVMLILAFVAGGFVLIRRAPSLGLSNRRILELSILVYFCALAGAYLLGVFSNFLLWLEEGGKFYKIFFSGLHAYGGFIGGLVSAYAYLRWSEPAKVAQYLDLSTPAIGLGIAITRIGCFLAGCDFGQISFGPLGVRFPIGSPAASQQVSLGLISPEAPFSLPVLPTQLFESAVGLIIFLSFQYVVHPLAQKKRWHHGTVLALGVLTYAIWRFLVEFVRDDIDRGIHLGLSTSQWISMITGGAAVAWIIQKYRAKGSMTTVRE